MLIRSYTPTRPVTEKEEDGSFDLVVKTYFPDERQPGGAMSNILDCMPLGEEIEIRGPTGEISYLGNGKFNIEGKEKPFSKVSLVLGGSGITPGYALIARILNEEGDGTQLRVIDANKSEADILMREEMDEFQQKHKEQFRICHVLSHPNEEWKGLKGHVDKDVIRENMFAPDGGKESVVFLCGPPGMIQKAALPALKDWGYEEERDCFGF
jgi:nitrate reductase (NAD(P)H)